MKNKSNRTKLILFFYSLFITIIIIGLAITFMQFITPSGSDNLPSVLLVPNEEVVIGTEITINSRGILLLDDIQLEKIG